MWGGACLDVSHAQERAQDVSLGSETDGPKAESGGGLRAPRAGFWHSHDRPKVFHYFQHSGWPLLALVYYHAAIGVRKDPVAPRVRPWPRRCILHQCVARFVSEFNARSNNNQFVVDQQRQLNARCLSVALVDDSFESCPWLNLNRISDGGGLAYSGSGLVSISEVTLRRTRLVPGWATVSTCNQSPRPTRPSMVAASENEEWSM